MTPYTTTTNGLQQAASGPEPLFYVYRPDLDYYLGPRHAGWRLPTDTLAKAETESANFFLLPEDLRRLQIDLGIGAIRQFASALPYYDRFPERHLFWSSHDDPCSPLPESLFCKTSVSRQQIGTIISVPYLVDNFKQYCPFNPKQILWQTCFVGYPGSSPLREQLLLAVAASKELLSHIDIAPKFHSHLDQITREKRRENYLKKLTSSLTVLCPRGDGMNSIRFFETLSMGRIPVLISDDCVLPFEALIPYERFVIRIAERDIIYAPEIISRWIQQKSSDELAQRCREARNAWEQLLAPERVMQTLQRTLTSLHLNLNTPPTTVVASEADLEQALSAYTAGDFSRAERLFRELLEARPGNPVFIKSLALLLNEAGKFEENIALLTSWPDLPGLHRLRGEAHLQIGQAEQAYQEFLQAIPEDPQNTQLLMNMGIACSKLNRQGEALTFLRYAMQIAPASASLLMNFGCVLQSLNRIDEASAAFRNALSLEPHYSTAAWNLAQILLLQGKFEEGFALFETRFSKRDPVSHLQVTAPLWQGEPLTNKTIIITTEQAFGDAIQFVRYLPLLAAQDVRVILYNHLKPLQRLFQSVPGIFSVIATPAEAPVADYYLPMLSLPRLFGTNLTSIPNQTIPYLAADRHILALWHNRLKDISAVKIGLCWAGRSEPDPRRSATLHDFAPLAKLSGAVFYSLQLGKESGQAAAPPPGMRLIDKTKDINDFEDTAALITLLDMVITVDTSVAHLAGALAKPVAVLLPFAPDWRWMLDREDSPWYPTMRLFRQEHPGDWSGPIEKVLASLSATSAARD